MSGFQPDPDAISRLASNTQVTEAIARLQVGTAEADRLAQLTFDAMRQRLETLTGRALDHAEAELGEIAGGVFRLPPAPQLDPADLNRSGQELGRWRDRVFRQASEGYADMHDVTSLDPHDDSYAQALTWYGKVLAPLRPLLAISGMLRAMASPDAREQLASYASGMRNVEEAWAGVTGEQEVDVRQANTGDLDRGVTGADEAAQDVASGAVWAERFRAYQVADHEVGVRQGQLYELVLPHVPVYDEGTLDATVEAVDREQSLRAAADQLGLSGSVDPTVSDRAVLGADDGQRSIRDAVTEAEFGRWLDSLPTLPASEEPDVVQGIEVALDGQTTAPADLNRADESSFRDPGAIGDDPDGPLGKGPERGPSSLS